VDLGDAHANANADANAGAHAGACAKTYLEQVDARIRESLEAVRRVLTSVVA
jgi:hypothetical protein